MKKRVLALLTMLVVLVACVCLGKTGANASTQRYQVGYAIKYVNPYVYSGNLGVGVKDLGDLVDTENWVHEVEISDPATGSVTTEKMIGVPLSGYANSAERPSGGIYDDNGDGYTGIGDGLYITCTTVTDERGTTLIYFTLDAISGYANVTNDAAKGVVAALGSTVMTENVFVNGSHTHEGPDYGTLGTALDSEVTAAVKAAKAEAGAAGETFDEAAFKASYVPSAKVQLWKAYYDYVIDTMVSAAVECYNNRTEAVMTKGSVDASESSGYQLNFIRNYNVLEYNGFLNVLMNKVTSTWQFGSNFGKSATATNTTTLKRTVNHTSEADDMMHILQFTPTNGDQPIVLVNWRSHATMMSSYTGGGTGALISSDYINSFRYQMQKAGYRMAFLQGAAGNSISTSSLGSPWSTERDTTKYPNHVIYYGGQMLTGVALDCLENYMTDEIAAGPIRSMRWTLDLEKQVDSEGLIAAAKAYQDNGNTGSNYKYTHTDGKVYIINTKHHARNVVSRSTGNANTYADMTVNAFMLGESVAFVTAPSEIVDRYSLTATLADMSDNDWDDLIDEDGYGTPFVMGYTNGHNGYTANNISFSYNEGSSDYGVGSYEANSSRNAAGEGEKMVAQMGKMLAILNDGYKEAYCEHCKETVEWKPLYAMSMRTTSSLGSGHYYLMEDIPNPGKDNYARIQGNVCFDLNGKEMNAFGRAFNITGTTTDYDGKATLNLMDSVGGGSVNSHDSSNGVGGGCITTSAGAVINMYSGTLRMITGEEVHVTKGGVVQLNNATMNMYGGTIDASQCYMAKDTGNHVSGDTDGCGAAVAVYANAKLNVSGGRIISGHAEPEEGRADCVLVQGTSANVTLSGDPEIDELYFDANPAATLVISGTFTGKVTLNYRPTITLSDNKDIGNLINSGSFTTGHVNCAVANFFPVVSGTNIRLVSAGAQTTDGDKINYYQNLQHAVNEADGKLIVLLKRNTTTTQVTQDAWLDLNGYAVTGKITVSAGNTLYCKDSASDDYTVADGKYGKISTVSGQVAGVPAESPLAEDGYLMVTESDGKRSFHRVKLEIYAMTLRPEVNGVFEPGVYYKSEFTGDEMVKEQVSTFGIALSVKEMPNAENMETKCKYSWFEGFESGEGGNDTSVTGTLLKGIMKTRNKKTLNAKYSEMPVYGRPYIKDQNGNYLFGEGVSRTLREQIELIDEQWETVGENQAGVATLCRKYEEVVKTWKIANIRQAIRNGIGSNTEPEQPKFNNDNLVFTSGNKAVCPACQKEAEWIAITQETYGTTGVAWQNVEGLHYYLAEDINYTGTESFIQGPGSSRKLCIHLNGHNFTGTAPFLFGYGSKSCIMGNGIVANSKNAESSGAVVWNTGTKTNVNIHLYGGTYTVTPENTKGSAIAIQNNGGEIYIHEDVKVIGSATAPAISIGTSNLRTSELYVTGASVEGAVKISNLATAKGYSTTLVITDAVLDSVVLGKDVSFTVEGDTTIEKLTVTEGAKFTVGDLGIAAEICVQGSGTISEANDYVPLYFDYFKPCSGDLKIENNALVVS